MTDVMREKGPRQPQKRVTRSAYPPNLTEGSIPGRNKRAFRWKGHQRDNAKFLFVDLGLTYNEVEYILGIPRASLIRYISSCTDRKMHFGLNPGRPRHLHIPKGWK